jgi:AAA domain
MSPLDPEEALKRREDFISVTPNEWLPPREILLNRELQSVSWVLPNNIPEGIGLIAGSSGVGKTVAVSPLACAVAGFVQADSNLTTKVHRKVVFFTEDDAQIDRSFYGVRIKLENEGQKIDFEYFKNMVHVYPAQRLYAEANKNRVQWAVDNFSIDHPILGSVPPLIIFDTASANFDLEDENSSAQVGRTVSALKEVYLSTKAPIWIIAHLVKSAKGMTIDELLKLSARGSGAWEADCSWTAIIGRESDSSRKTILKIDKERTGGLRGHEIHFEVEFDEECLTDALGDSVMQRYPLVTMKQGDKKGRQEMANERILQDVISAIARRIEASDRKHLFASEVKTLMNIKSSEKRKLLDELIIQKRIKQINTPHESHKDHKVAYVIPTLGEKLSSVLPGIVGNDGLKNSSKTGDF